MALPWGQLPVPGSPEQWWAFADFLGEFSWAEVHSAAGAKAWGGRACRPQAVQEFWPPGELSQVGPLHGQLGSSTAQ